MRSEAGGAAFIVLQEARPCFRQAEQPQGVSGRSGVENDVIEAWRVPGEQADELIERGDLRRAGTRKLLPHRRLFGIAGIGRQLLEHASPISVRRGFGIDVHREEPLNLGNRLRRVGEFDAQHLVEIGGGIVLTSSTRRPRSARAMALAQLSEVLPTPPFPVKNRKGVGSFKALNRVMALSRAGTPEPTYSRIARTDLIESNRTGGTATVPDRQNPSRQASSLGTGSTTC